MKMRILYIIPYVVFACVPFLKFTADTSPLEVIDDSISGMISTQDTPFNFLPAFLPLALPFILLIFILFVKSSLTTKIFVNKFVRYPLYIIGIGLFLISCWPLIGSVFDDPTAWGFYLFLSIYLICLCALFWLFRVNLPEAENLLLFLMLCYFPNTIFCVVVYMFSWGLNIGGYIALISILYFIAEIRCIVWRHRKSVQQIAVA